MKIKKSSLYLKEFSNEVFGSGKRNSGSKNSLNGSIIGWGGIEPLYVKNEKKFKNIEQSEIEQRKAQL